MQIPTMEDLGNWGSSSYGFANGYSLMIYDPETHLRALGQEYDLSIEDRFEVTITHNGMNLCYLNPAGSGQARLDSLTWENVINIFKILDDDPGDRNCPHAIEPIAMRMAQHCTRCNGLGEFTDNRGRIRSCNCIEGRV